MKQVDLYMGCMLTFLGAFVMYMALGPIGAVATALLGFSATKRFVLDVSDLEYQSIRG